MQPDGKILISGAFTEACGVPRTDVVRLNADGTLDGSFAPGIALSPDADKMASVMAMALQADGGVLVAGDFWMVDGARRDGLARLFGGTNDCQGVIALAADRFAVNENESNAVITVRRDGANLGPATVRYAVCRLGHVSGWAGWLPADEQVDFEPEGSAETLTGLLQFAAGDIEKAIQVPILNDVLVEATESFEVVLGQPTDGATLLGPVKALVHIYDDDVSSFPGAVDTAYSAGLGTNDAVQAVLVQPDGKVLIGGNFSLVQGMRRRSPPDPAAGPCRLHPRLPAQHPCARHRIEVSRLPRIVLSDAAVPRHVRLAGQQNNLQILAPPRQTPCAGTARRKPPQTPPSP